MPGSKRRPKPLAINVTDTAEMLGLSRSSIYRLLASGQLTAKKVLITSGKKHPSHAEATLILYASVEAYFAGLPDFVSSNESAPIRSHRLRAVK